MQPGYPQSRGGGSPAFYQYWHNDALQSMQKNSTAPANGQNNLAIPNTLNMVYGPPQRQQNKLQVILQHYGPQDLIQIKPNGHHHRSTEVNTLSQAFVHVSVQSHNFPTSGNVVGQQRKLLKSDLNKEHQQKQLLHCSSLESTNSAVIQSDSLGVAAQTPEHMMRVLQSAPMLCALLKGNPTNKVSLPTLSLRSEENNGSTCRHPTIQNQQSSGTQTRPHQQQDVTSSVSSQRGLQAGTTDNQILDYIKEKIKMLMTQTDGGHKNKNKRLNSNNMDSLKSNIKSDTSAYSTTFNSEEGQGLDHAVTEHYLSTFWPQHEVDSSEGSKANPETAVKSDVVDSCATSAPEQRHTEYPQIMEKVADSLTKNEDEVPIVLTTLSEMTMDELSENHPGSTLNCSFSEEYQTLWLNTNSNLDRIDQVPGVSLSLMSEKKIVVPKAEVGQIDCVENPSMDSTFKFSRSRACKVVSEYEEMKNTEEQHQLIQHTGSKFKSQPAKFQICDVKSLQEQSGKHSNQKHLKGKQDSVYLGFELFESKVERQEPLLQSKVEVFCKNPQYEDISDEDQPRMVTQVAETIHEGSDVLVGCRNPQYEDISEDDNSQNKNFDLEIQMAESNSAQSPLENKDFRHKQRQAEMKADISIEDQAPEFPDEVQKCCCPYYIETEYGFESTLCPKCERHLERQKDQPIICSSLSDQKNEDADDQNSDSESDDDFIVIPLIVSNLIKCETEDQIHKSKDIIVLSDDETSETEGEGKQAGSSSANCIEIYETLESYLREQKPGRFSDHLAASSNVSDRITSECEMSSTGSIPYPTVPSETEGSSETEDSCNYSSDPESNYLTVPKFLWVESSSPGPVEADDSVAENEVNDDMNVHTSKAMACPTSKAGSSDKSTTFQKLKQLINTKSNLKRTRPKGNKQRISQQNYTTGSESEDESGQNCKKVKKGLSSSRSDAPNTQHHGHPPKVLYSEIYHAQFEDAMNDDSSGLTNTAEKTRHLVETNASSEHVPHNSNRCKISENEHSVSQARRDPDFKKAKGKSLFSELGKTDKAQRHSPEPVHIHSKTGTGKSSANLSYAQNKVYNAQFGDMKKSCSYLSNSEQWIKDNVVSRHWQKTLEDKGSEPKRRSAETVSQLYGAGGKPSSKSAAEKPQSVAQVSGSKLISSSTIPNLVVNKSREHCDGLKQPDKDKTRTLSTTDTTKKNDSSKKKNLKNVNKREMGKFVSKPQLPKDKHHASENRDHASKAKQFSRQLSLPNQLPFAHKNNYESRNSSAYSSSDAEISVSSNLLTFEQNPSIPKQHSSRFRQSHYSSVSHHQGTSSGSVSSSTMQTSAKKQVTKNWNDSYFPTRKDKKTNLGAEEDRRYQESSKETRPGPSHERVRQRNNSNESDRPLMKRAKDDFRKFSEGRIRDPSMDQSPNVGEGYKWKEKPPAARLQKVKSTIPHRRLSTLAP